jgi:hypothetical protein
VLPGTLHRPISWLPLKCNALFLAGSHFTSMSPCAKSRHIQTGRCKGKSEVDEARVRAALVYKPGGHA